MVNEYRAMFNEYRTMLNASKSLRLVLAALVVMVLGGLAITLIQLTDTALSIQQRLAQLPAWIAWPLGLALIVLAASIVVLVWKLLRPAKVEAPAPRQLDRASIEQRANRLLRSAQESERPQSESAKIQTPSVTGVITAPLDPPATSQQVLARQVNAELDGLAQRQATQLAYLAMFGEISVGKSSLIRALLRDSGTESPSTQSLSPESPSTESPLVNVLGGTTREVKTYSASIDAMPVMIADVPGTNEVDAKARAVMAREEALRAHVVALVVGGDLTRSQAEEWQWLQGFKKPVWLILSKIDRYEAHELSALRQRLKEKFGSAPLCVHSGFSETIDVQAANGSIETRQRTHAAQVGELQQALRRFLHEFNGATRTRLEQRRQHAVLSSLDLKLADAEQKLLREKAEQLVRSYQRKAIIGALASVAPGTDLLVQGALAAGLIKNLTDLYGVAMKDVDVDDLLRWFGGRFKASSTALLAVAGNAAKAFPGLGTLGGGVMHAIAYGLIFESVGKSLIDCLEQRHLAADGLDRERLLAGFKLDIQDHKKLIVRAGQLAKAIWSGEYR